MSNRNFLNRMVPLIEAASEAARDRAKRVIGDGHILWQVYVTERQQLLHDATRVDNGEPTKDGVPMSEKDFEAYLITLSGESESTVWAWDADDDSDDRSI